MPLRKLQAPHRSVPDGAAWPETLGFPDMPSSTSARAVSQRKSFDEESAATRVSTRKRVSPSRAVVKGDGSVKITRAVTIRQPADLLYRFWRDLENLTRVIKHPVKITRVSDIASHWAVSAPGDRQVEWDAVIINDAPGRLIAWRSRQDAEVPNAGTVRFEPIHGDEGTEVTVTLEYNPPVGKLGAWVAKLSGDEPRQQISETLRRFKALMEAGEIPTTEGQPAGRPQRRRAA